MAQQETKPAHAASEQQYTAAGREVKILWLRIHKRRKAEEGD